MMDTSLKIDGMHCNGCVRSVEKTAAAVPGVSEVTVDLQSGLLNAKLASPEDERHLRDAIEAIGFDATPV